MPRALLLRTITLVLALVHTFPARKHMASLLATPSWTEAWKGVGAVLAVSLYVLPVAVQARGLQWIWRRSPQALRGAGIALALAHAVPVFDHVPRFLATPSWGDGWRAAGAICAVAWFVAPLAAQARVLARLARLAQALPRTKANEALPSG